MGERGGTPEPGPRPPEDDPKLIARVRSRDRAAFEELVERYQDFVFSVGFRFLGGDGDGVEEVAQEVFLRVWDSAAKFEGRGKLSTWLYVLAMNAARDRLRKAGKHSRIAEHLGQGAGQARKRAPEPLEQIASREEQRELDEALAKLPEEQKQILILKYAEGLSYPEISDILGLSVPALKMRASRAREALRNLLAPGADEEEAK